MRKILRVRKTLGEKKKTEKKKKQINPSVKVNEKEEKLS